MNDGERMMERERARERQSEADAGRRNDGVSVLNLKRENNFC